MAWKSWYLFGPLAVQALVLIDVATNVGVYAILQQQQDLAIRAHQVDTDGLGFGGVGWHVVALGVGGGGGFGHLVVATHSRRAPPSSQQHTHAPPP